jgi:hypothetical protein
LTTGLGQFGRKSGQNRYEGEKVVRTDKRLNEITARSARARVIAGLERFVSGTY